mmetsp:Transcript_101692/g.286697  ORF Transcript_101692/g.286697 Transcript_101692/m.286697 type:complete len:202 (+) Transcript_101692:272-877(+)
MSTDAGACSCCDSKTGARWWKARPFSHSKADPPGALGAQFRQLSILPANAWGKPLPSLAPPRSWLCPKPCSSIFFCKTITPGSRAAAGSRPRTELPDAVEAKCCSASMRPATAIGKQPPSASPRPSSTAGRVWGDGCRRCQKLHSTTACGGLGPNMCASSAGSVATNRPRKRYSGEDGGDPRSTEAGTAAGVPLGADPDEA